jgi:hypothetical protein
VRGVDAASLAPRGGRIGDGMLMRWSLKGGDRE